MKSRENHSAILASRAPGDETPPPPYLACGAHNLIVRFEADEAAVRALLPPGLEPASTIVTLNMYCVRRALGVPPYTRTYIWTDLKGFDAWDGTLGRYVLVGWAEPDGFRAIATRLLHWPAEQGATHVDFDGARDVRATLRVGDAGLIVARASRPEGAIGQAFANLLPYVSADEAALAANRPVKRENVGDPPHPFHGDGTATQSTLGRFPGAGRPSARRPAAEAAGRGRRGPGRHLRPGGHPSCGGTVWTLRNSSSASRASGVGRRRLTRRLATALSPAVRAAQRARESRAACRHARPQAAQLRSPEAIGLDQQGLEGNTPTILEFDRVPVVRHPFLAIYHKDVLARAACHLGSSTIRSDAMRSERYYCIAAKQSLHGGIAASDTQSQRGE